MAAQRRQLHAEAALQAFGMLYMPDAPPSSQPTARAPRGPRGSVAEASGSQGGQGVDKRKRRRQDVVVEIKSESPSGEEEASGSQGVAEASGGHGVAEASGGQGVDHTVEAQEQQQELEWVMVHPDDVPKPDFYASDAKDLSKRMAIFLRYHAQDTGGWVELGELVRHLSAPDPCALISIAAHSWHPKQQAYRFEVSQYGEQFFVRAAWTKQAGVLVDMDKSTSSAWGSGGQVVNVKSQPRVPNRPLKQGEWLCSSCGNLNFAGRETCHFRGCKTNIFKAGDWICRRCQAHNYRRNSVCHNCGH